MIQLPIDLPENHHGADVAVGCFDQRMGAKFVLFFDIYLRRNDYFRLNFPGGAKLINEFPEIVPLFFDTAIKVCGARKIVILDHEDCIAWGGSNAFKSKKEERALHANQLLSAGEYLKSIYHEYNLQIKLFYAEFSESRKGKMLDFTRVRKDSLSIM